MTTVIERQRTGAADAVQKLSPSDVDDVVAMHSRCTPQARYARWHGHTKRFPPSYLARLLDDDIAVIARRDDVVVGLGSAARIDAETWEIGLLVEDAWQRRGIGGLLLTELIELARREGAAVIRAEVLEQDVDLLQPLRALGPLTARTSHGVVTAEVRPWA